MPEKALRIFLSQHLRTAPGVRGIVVAFSGGLDSTVLLHALLQVAREFAMPLRAIHVHHGLSPNADAWAAHARQFCAERQVALDVVQVHVEKEASLEAAARRARYRVFSSALRSDEALLLAQHRDDQAETVLFRLLRGAGVTGLAAMRPSRMLQIAQGDRVPQWRPFLDTSRRCLEQYATAHGLEWIEDESNRDMRHARNFLRHEVIPLLEQRWPVARKMLAAAARRLGEADTLLEEYATLLGKDCIKARGELSISLLMELSVPQQRLVLRHWLRRQGFPMPGEAGLEKILNELVPACNDATPLLVTGEVEIRRYRDHLFALRSPLPLPFAWEAAWDGIAPLCLPDGRTLHLEHGEKPEEPWLVRFRRGGERFRPAAGRPSRQVKTLLQEAAVPPWLRDRLPLVFEGDELVAIAGLTLPGVEQRLRFCIELPRGEDTQ